MYHTQIIYTFQFYLTLVLQMFFAQITHVVTCMLETAGIQHEASGGIAFVHLVDATCVGDPSAPKHIHWNNTLPPPGHFIIA